MKRFEEILNPQIVPNNKIRKTNESIASPSGFTLITASASASASASATTTTKITSAANPKSTKSNAEVELLKSKKIWEVAIAPAKSIPMNLFMSYMTGNSLQIIPMSMTLMLLWNPIKAIFNDTNISFSKLETKSNRGQITLAKLVFILFQVLNMGVGVYKLYKMGLIPHTEADWLAWKEYAPPLERVYI